MEEIWDLQKKFTERVVKRLDKKLTKFTPEDKVKWTKEYLLCIISECMEVLEQLNWKHHRPNDISDINVKNVAIELVDVQKYIWGLMNIWGIDYGQFVEAFKEKSYEVEKSFIQNFEFKDIKSGSSKNCIIDIDGVLNSYPVCFYDWVLATAGVKPEEYQKDRVKYEAYKRLYRISGAKRELRVDPQSLLALQLLKEKNYTIILLTNRPYEEYKNIIGDTYHWLDSNQIPYDYIFWSKDRKLVSIIDKVPKIDFIVDDLLETCIDFENYGIKAYLFGNGSFHRKISSLLELEELK